MKSLDIFKPKRKLLAIAPGLILTKPGKKNYIVGFSGGRTSAMMAERMRRDVYYSKQNLIYIYSNTGKEREETLEFVEECDKRFNLGVIWIEPKINGWRVGTTYTRVNFHTARRKGEPFEEAIQKYGIPNQTFRWCSRDLKERPITALADDLCGKGNYVNALGMRFDEIKRIDRFNPKICYPMVDWGIAIKEVRAFWNAQPFDLRLKDYEGNCDLCWKKSLRKKMTLVKENPASAQWWLEMEKKYGMLQIKGRPELTEPQRFNRGYMPVSEIVSLSNQPFPLVTDPLYKVLDVESSCSCSRDTALEEDDE